MRSEKSALGVKNIKQDIKSGLVRWIVFLATILAGWIIYAAIGSTRTNPATLEVWAWSGLSATSWNKLLENFNNHENRINTLNTTVTSLPAAPQFLWYAQQNAYLTVSSATWTDLPWTSVTFNLSTPKKVWMRAYWSITPDWGTGTATHCWFKFVIDWITTYWDPTWWDQIIWCWTSSSGYWRWCNWNIERILDLWTWTHTIKTQMIGRGATYPWCSSNTADYGRARLFVETKN